MFGLVARSGMCVAVEVARAIDDGGLARQEDGAVVWDSAGPRPSPTNPCGDCPVGQTCATDSERCVDFCGLPATQSPSNPTLEPIYCGGEVAPGQAERVELSFEDTCVNACQLRCRRQGWFCKSGCGPNDCEKPEVQADCRARCDGAPGRLACVQSLCSDARSLGCATGGLCPGGEAAACAQVTCSNLCATAYDGVCDDGDLGTSAYASCTWGTDCSDCGPRVGDDRSRNRKQGELCERQAHCIGASTDFAQNAAFCVAVAAGERVKRCVLDCSRFDEPCPVGTTCTTMETAAGVLRDARGLVGRACLPDACAN